MASIKRWLYQRFRWVVGIPLLLVLLGIAVQALADIGDIDSYLLQGAGWVVYLIAMVGWIESGKAQKSRRTGRGARTKQSERSPDDDSEARTEDVPAPKRPSGGKRTRAKQPADEPDQGKHKPAAGGHKPASAVSTSARKSDSPVSASARKPRKRAPQQRRAESTAKESHRS